jgi:3-hydroxy acid dehydrogenase/malonic semialdehyde reductase
VSARKVVVTGASRGIGFAISRRLSAAGFAVTGVARRFNEAEPDVFARTVCVDLADIGEIDGFARRLAEEEADADALVLAAGAGRFAPVESMPVADMRYVVDLDLVSPMIVSRAFVPKFKARRRGDIVFIGSEAAHHPGPRGAAYCAAKFGLRGYAGSLRIECASRGVRVSLVNPGMTDTGFYDGLDFSPGRSEAQHLRASDVAHAVELVLSAPPGTVFDEINLTPLTHVIDFSRRRGE